MTYSWILLDADGTLFDYDAAEAKALAATFAVANIPHNNGYTKTYRQINAAIWADFELGKISQQELRAERFRRLFQAIAIEADPHAFSDAYLIELGNRGDLIDGAREILQTIHNDYHLLLITNGIPEVQRPRLAHSGLGHFFDAVIISGEVGVAKPDPAIFDAAFAAMGHPAKEETLIIGDSLTSDIQGGINYGIDTCWYNPSRLSLPPATPITYEINALSELHELLSTKS